MAKPGGKPKRKAAQAKAAAPAAFAPEFTIVGVGGSAGGFEAFGQLLGAVPAEANLALIYVPHLSPTHESALTVLLPRFTPFPVTEAVEGMRVKPRNIYVVPANVQMELVDGHLHLGPRPLDKSQYTPIDVFFRSLARTLRAHAIGVVLSGTASDGAMGVREIKTLGGISIVQDPMTAKYDGMPRAALATRAVDLVLPAAAIGAKLGEIAENPNLAHLGDGPRDEPEPRLPVTDEQLEQVLKLLVPSSGIDFMHYKTPTIIRRLLRRMSLHRIADVPGYIEYLKQNADEVAKLHNDLLIHVTRFFREPEAFEVLAREVLPHVDARQESPMRAWVAGCATGEEVYSLAMVIQESMEDTAGPSRVQIFGTDVSETAVEYARHGLYPASIAGDVTQDRLKRFFTRLDGGYKVNKSLRDMCVFARHDLTRDPPFSRLDLICCRNVLIYMDTRLQKKLLAMFHYALKPAGVLLLGHAETIGYNSEVFDLMDKKHRLFRKKPGAAAPGHMETPVPQLKPPEPLRRLVGTAQGSHAVLAEANRVVLDRYAPPSVLVDQNLHVVQFNGQTGPFLEPSPGEPSFNVLKLAREGLLHGLRTALQSSRKSRRPVRREGLHVRNGSQWQTVDIEVVPVIHQNQTFHLVMFETPRKARREPAKERPVLKGSGRNQQVATLESELAATREYLQSTIQEIEAANEELQSANEEILSSNEELQSTNEELDTAKEELQSTNEELNTVNDELHGRNEELTRANADLINLLASVEIAIVIVSRDLRIRRFTPMAEKKFNLIQGDVGRPFSQISSTLHLPDLPTLISEAIDTVSRVERTVKDDKGESYLLRIRPYKTPDNRIDGAVIALFDVGSRKD
jgi:two-component system CheB/CheR fusion protein